MTLNSANLTIDDARVRIRTAGLRATPGRIAVLQVLSSQTVPLTHAELVEHLADQGSDASTIFRALNDMADAGLLRRMELGDHVWRYEAHEAAAEHGDAHPHFLCTDCGAITCLDSLDMRPFNKENRHLRKVGKVTEVLLKGQCVTCNSKD